MSYKKYNSLEYYQKFVKMEFQCSDCHYESGKKENVKRHILAKCQTAEIIEIPVEIKCEYCKKTYATSTSLSRHLKTCREKNKKQIPVLNKIDNFMYILQEREFIVTKQNVYKLGITKSLHNRINAYPKGSKIFCVMPVEDDPEIKFLHKFRERFISRADIGSEYFEGDINDMINALYTGI